ASARRDTCGTADRRQAWCASARRDTCGTADHRQAECASAFFPFGAGIWRRKNCALILSGAICCGCREKNIA
ncbi:MAG: hypothetical protein IJJ33_20530, partial [Victivallales bacterium]|nr:hypothetical protein [Victivallales bacterium]